MGTPSSGKPKSKPRGEGERVGKNRRKRKPRALRRCDVWWEKHIVTRNAGIFYFARG